MFRTPPIDAGLLQTALVGTRFTDIRVVPETGSTNADVVAAAHAGAPEGLVIVAEHQTAGRGRFRRRWEDTEGTSIAMSLLLRPAAETMPRWGWLPLLAGMATCEGIAASTGLSTQLKWPNDILVSHGPWPGKLVGILAEGASTPDGPAVVVGTGINVAMDVAELPVEQATSVTLSGVTDPDRTAIVAAVLSSWDGLYSRWAAGEDLVPAYLARCATIGREVRVQLDAQRGLGEAAEGTAIGVDPEGSLLVRLADDTVHALSAGDVIHVR